MTSLQELLDQKVSLERQISEAMRASRSDAIAKIRTLMTEHGLTAADMVPTQQKRAASTGSGTHHKVAPKYRHPTTGATWSGRGLRPKWLSEELANGMHMVDFAI